MSFKMAIAWLVRAINSSYLSMPSTLKRKHKPALGEGQKPVDNYVDTSRNRRSYPQAGQSGRDIEWKRGLASKAMSKSGP